MDVEGRQLLSAKPAPNKDTKANTGNKQAEKKKSATKPEGRHLLEVDGVELLADESRQLLAEKKPKEKKSANTGTKDKKKQTPKTSQGKHLLSGEWCGVECEGMSRQDCTPA